MPVPSRSDARRNRTAILQAADEVLTHGTEPIPLPQIARRAGVGQATLYRHFSDRRTLAVAVMREQFAALTELVDNQGDDPGAFRRTLHVVLSSQARMRPLVTLLTELPLREQIRHAERLLNTLSRALLQAQDAGLARPDVRIGDLLTMFAMVEAAVDVAAALPDPGQREAAVTRVVGVLVDGVCTP